MPRSLYAVVASLSLGALAVSAHAQTTAKATTTAASGSASIGSPRLSASTSASSSTTFLPASAVTSAPAPTVTAAAPAYDGLPSPLRADDVVAWARAHRSEIVAAKAKAAAAAATSRVVSALPDPMVMAAIDHLPFKLDGFNWSVLVQQDFPLGGVLGARGRVADAEGRATAEDARTIELDVQLQALAAYLMWIELERSTVVVDEQLEIARQVLELAKIHVSVAESVAADLVRADVDVVRLEGERSSIDAELSAARSMLNASLGRVATDPLPLADLIVPSSDPPIATELVTRAIGARPEVAALVARTEKSREHVDEMDAMYTPMAFVRAGYAQTMFDGPGVMLMVGVSVPIWRDKLAGGLDEANSMATMADADLAAAKRMIEGEVVAAREQVIAARILYESVHERLIPLAQKALTLTMTSYGAGQVPLVSVLDAARMVRESRMEDVAAGIKVAAAWAKLGRAIGMAKVGT